MSSCEQNPCEEDTDLNAVEVNDAMLQEYFLDACQRGDTETLSTLSKQLSKAELHQILHQVSGCIGTPLFEAIALQQTEVVAFLLSLNIYDLEHEHDINIFYPISFRDISTPLCLACACGEVEIVELLLQHGADVNKSSQHSSPLIYASEYNNVQLISILLKYGAKINVVPRGLQTKSSVLPLFQACLNGHTGTAELLLASSASYLPLDKHVTLLGLLGAQTINQNQDFENGLKYWRQALTLLDEEAGKLGQQEKAAQVKGHDQKEELRKAEFPVISTDREMVSLESQMAKKLRILYNDENMGGDDPLEGTSQSEKHQTNEVRVSILRDTKLCTSIEELETLDETALSLQALAVLERILGPDHPETSQQMAQAAHIALEKGDLSTACKLYLNIIETNEARDYTGKALGYASQMADLLLKAWMESRDVVTEMKDCTDLLLSALELVRVGAGKMCDLLGAPSHGAAFSDSSSKQIHRHSKISMLSEMSETFVAFLYMLVELALEPQEIRTLRQTVAAFLKLGNHKHCGKYNLEVEVFRLAVYGGLSASSTLYFFQEDILPSIKITELFTQCGGNVNCQDNLSGDSPLHFSLDGPSVNSEVIKLLLTNGAHIDIVNCYGITPESLLKRQRSLRINPFIHLTLKCLAARVVANAGIPYIDQIPRQLETFVPWHGTARSSRNTPQREHNRSSHIES